MVSLTWWFGVWGGERKITLFPHGSTFSKLVFCREKCVLGVGWWAEIGVELPEGQDWASKVEK